MNFFAGRVSNVYAMKWLDRLISKTNLLWTVFVLAVEAIFGNLAVSTKSSCFMLKHIFLHGSCNCLTSRSVILTTFNGSALDFNLKKIAEYSNLNH